ncbi:MAG: hypothetical protein HYW27_01580 [Candidatus Aenigmarchaeota archaeon]|nr:hypothetical protein [Candidatus Aenigmarchaeota archaeon]
MNRHVKTINGRKYYYKSIRRGGKVTSEYLGPVERIRRKKAKAVKDEVVEEETTEENEKDDGKEEDYIG